MFVGYAELFNGKGSIICVFVKVHDANIRKIITNIFANMYKKVVYDIFL